PEPLTADLGAFWNGGTPAADSFGEVAIPPIPAALPRRLGGFPFWRGRQPLLDALEPDYAAASVRGLDAFLGPGTDAPSAGRP
ncbi:MAG TPA: hypothetical protein VF590_14505, partial [Isosphaeraceae bacterium]